MSHERPYRFYSAKIVEPTAHKPERRIRIVNRETGYTYYRPMPANAQSLSDESALKARVRNLHSSPILGVRILWYDKSLQALFFEQIEIEEQKDGCETPA